MTKTVNPFLSLQALLGWHGVKTSLLMSNQDFWTCAHALWPGKIREFKDATLEDLQQQIKAMSKGERRHLGRENVRNIPANWLSDAPVHQAKLQRAGA